MKTSRFLMLIAAFCCSGCFWRNLTADQETAAAQASLRWLAEKYGTVSTPETAKFLSGVAERINLAAAIVPHSNRQAQNANWSVVVINAPEINAFSLGAGTIVVTRGLVLEVGTEAEFAAVVAHEMSHQYLGHTEAALAKTSAHSHSPTFSYAESEEIDADTMAVKLLSAARYDPRHAQRALEMAYRPAERVVASPGWIEAREVNLKRQIDSVGCFLPATQTSREFERFRFITSSLS